MKYFCIHFLPIFFLNPFFLKFKPSLALADSFEGKISFKSAKDYFLYIEEPFSKKGKYTLIFLPTTQGKQFAVDGLYVKIQGLSKSSYDEKKHIEVQEILPAIYDPLHWIRTKED